MPSFASPGWFGSFNPYQNDPNVDRDLDALFNDMSGNPQGGVNDWWERRSGASGSEANNDYWTRIARKIAEATRQTGRYSSGNDLLGLGRNVGAIVDVSKLQDAANANTGGSGLTRDYLRQKLGAFLKGGNVGMTTGTNTRSGDNSFESLYGRSAANAKAAEAAGDTNAVNFYRSSPVLGALGTVANIQTGGGQNAAAQETIGTLFDQSGENNGRWWENAKGELNNPWGGSFAPSRSFGQAPAPSVDQPVVPPPSAPTTTPTIPAPNPVTGIIETPADFQGPPSSGGSFAPPTTYQPPAPDRRPPDGPSMSELDWASAFDRGFEQAVGRPPSGLELAQWRDRWQNQYGGTADGLQRALTDIGNSAVGKARQAGRSLPVVTDPSDKDQIRRLYYAIWPNDESEGGPPVQEWVDNYQRAMLPYAGTVSRL